MIDRQNDELHGTGIPYIAIRLLRGGGMQHSRWVSEAASTLLLLSLRKATDLKSDDRQTTPQREVCPHVDCCENHEMLLTTKA